MTKATRQLVIVWLVLILLLGGTLVVVRYVAGGSTRHRTIPVIRIDVREETAQHWLRHFHELLKKSQKNCVCPAAKRKPGQGAQANMRE